MFHLFTLKTRYTIKTYDLLETVIQKTRRKILLVIGRAQRELQVYKALIACQHFRTLRPYSPMIPVFAGSDWLLYLASNQFISG